MSIPRVFRTYATILAAVLLTVGESANAEASARDASAPPPSPFAGFETWILPNDLKVWYKRLPDDPQVWIGVVVPAGQDQDPMGKEQLAHLTEHMLFSDHLGRTEEQVKREIEDRGGVRNGITTMDHTYYFVRIGKEHGLFALEWLHRVISPHAMDADVVERQREPVLLEVRAKRRQLLDWIDAVYMDPPWLRLPGFWQREFGLNTREDRDYYPYRSLQRIGPDDLRSFYDTHYVPSRMTLAVIGDLEREQVRRTVDETFATLTSRPAPVASTVLRDPRRYGQRIHWTDRPNVSYSRYFKLYDPTAREVQLLHFVRKYLDQRLDTRLRHGARKATYGLTVNVVQRDRAAYLGITGGVKDTEFDFTRGVIDEELSALALGAEDVLFEKERAAVAHHWRAQNTSASNLGERWVQASFYNPSLVRDLPDMVAFAEELTQEELRAFAGTHFVPEREFLHIIYRLPLSQSLLAFLVLTLIVLTLLGARRILVLPADMTRVRYVGRLRLPMAYKVFGIPVLVVLVAAAARLVAQLYLLLADRFLFAVESFTIRALVLAFALVVVVLSIVVLLSCFPRKLLIFDDHVRIKYLVYRSRKWAPQEIREVSLLRFSEVWTSYRLLHCVPLTFGLLEPGIYFRPLSGRAWYFRVRQSILVAELIDELRGSSGSRTTSE